MGFCVYFRRTWTPGYNTEFIDPNLAYSYQRKLNLAKKIAWWVFVLTLIVSVIVLLATLSTRSQEKGESRCPRSDQLGRPCHPDSFVCDAGAHPPSECIHKYLVCDTIKDCSNNRDEILCTAISPTLTHVQMNTSNDSLEGYVLVRVKGSWHPYCSDQWSNEMGKKICTFLGYNLLVGLDTVEIKEFLQDGGDRDTLESKLWVLSEDNNYSKMDTGSLKDAIYESNAENVSCSVAKLSCGK